MVDALDLKSNILWCEGSSPSAYIFGGCQSGLLYWPWKSLSEDRGFESLPALLLVLIFINILIKAHSYNLE